MVKLCIECNYAEYCYAKCHYADCHSAKIKDGLQIRVRVTKPKYLQNLKVDFYKSAANIIKSFLTRLSYSITLVTNFYKIDLCFG